MKSVLFFAVLAVTLYSASAQCSDATHRCQCRFEFCGEGWGYSTTTGKCTWGSFTDEAELILCPDLCDENTDRCLCRPEVCQPELVYAETLEQLSPTWGWSTSANDYEGACMTGKETTYEEVADCPVLCDVNTDLCDCHSGVCQPGWGWSTTVQMCTMGAESDDVELAECDLGDSALYTVSGFLVDTCQSQCDIAVPSNSSPEGYCYCDQFCFQWGDCCSDISIYCYIDPESIRPDKQEGSCVDMCGGLSDYCWCDTECVGFGDCCEDMFEQCGSSVKLMTSYDEAMWFTQGSCENNCGASSWDCFCDAKCVVVGDCCDDFLSVCKDIPLIEENHTCEGNCDGYADGCWCDDQCEMYSDCCDDILEFC